MTDEQLEELLGKVAPDPWNVTTPVKDSPDYRVIQYGNYGHSECGGYMIVSGMISHESATLIALAPSLARRVIAAEKLAEAIEGVTHYITGYAGSDEQDALDAAITAYREASK